jgi:hypothetical protein
MKLSEDAISEAQIKRLAAKYRRSLIRQGGERVVDLLEPQKIRHRGADTAPRRDKADPGNIS